MRELLEMAARAAGLRIRWMPASPGRRAMYWLEDVGEWNPITSDADAFRLAVKLGRAKTLVLTVGCGGSDCEFQHPMTNAFEGCDEGDPYAATRLAITRAAAEIGKSMGDEHARD